jgi:hypothetical protein
MKEKPRRQSASKPGLFSCDRRSAHAGVVYRRMSNEALSSRKERKCRRSLARPKWAVCYELLYVRRTSNWLPLLNDTVQLASDLPTTLRWRLISTYYLLCITVVCTVRGGQPLDQLNQNIPARHRAWCDSTFGVKELMDPTGHLHELTLSFLALTGHWTSPWLRRHLECVQWEYLVLEDYSNALMLRPINVTKDPANNSYACYTLSTTAYKIGTGATEGQAVFVQH